MRLRLFIFMQYLYVDDALTLFGETVCFDSPDLFVLYRTHFNFLLYIFFLKIKKKRGVGTCV